MLIMQVSCKTGNTFLLLFLMSSEAAQRKKGLAVHWSSSGGENATGSLVSCVRHATPHLTILFKTL
jgi:hypothetical protein